MLLDKEGTGPGAVDVPMTGQCVAGDEVWVTSADLGTRPRVEVSEQSVLSRPMDPVRMRSAAGPNLMRPHHRSWCAPIPHLEGITNPRPHCLGRPSAF